MSGQEGAIGPAWRLPILDYTRESYALLLANRGLLLRLSWIPLLVFVAASGTREFVLTSWLEPPGGRDIETSTRYFTWVSWLTFGVYLPLQAALIPVATAWSRLAVQGRAVAPGGRPYSIGRPELVFLAVALLYALGQQGMSLAVIYTISGFGLWPQLHGLVEGLGIRAWAIAWTVGETNSLLAAGLFLLIAIRLMLAFPATAITGRPAFAGSFRVLRGNATRLFLVYALATLPGLAIYLVQSLAKNPLSSMMLVHRALDFTGLEAYLWKLAFVGIDLCFFALPYLVLAFAYRDLVAAPRSNSSRVAKVFD